MNLSHQSLKLSTTIMLCGKFYFGHAVYGKYHLFVLYLYNLKYKNLWLLYITMNSRWPFPLHLLYASEENFTNLRHILFQLFFPCCLSLIICSSYHSHCNFLITLTIFSFLLCVKMHTVCNRQTSAWIYRTGHGYFLFILFIYLKFLE